MKFALTYYVFATFTLVGLENGVWARHRHGPAPQKNSPACCLWEARMDSVLANFLLSHSTELLQMSLGKKWHVASVKRTKGLNLADLVGFCVDVGEHNAIPVCALISHQ